MRNRESANDNKLNIVPLYFELTLNHVTRMDAERLVKISKENITAGR